jgi:hypothetical protein
MTSPDRQSKERGSAFVSVIALMAVLSALAVISVHAVLDTAYMGRQSRLGVQVEAAFDTAYAEALYLAANGEQVIRYAEPLTIQTSIGGVEVSFFSPSGRLDINHASPLLLTLLLEAAGSETPNHLAAAIADWRDSDDLLSNNGAEQFQYERAGLVGPANQVFAHEGELSGVLGMSDAVLACILNEVTIATGSMTPDLRFASPWLKQALNPQQDASTTAAVMPPVTLGAGDLIGLEMRILEGPATGRGASVMIRLTGDRRDPFWVQSFDYLAAEAPVCTGPITDAVPT